MGRLMCLGGFVANIVILNSILCIVSDDHRICICVYWLIVFHGWKTFFLIATHMTDMCGTINIKD